MCLAGFLRHSPHKAQVVVALSVSRDRFAAEGAPLIGWSSRSSVSVATHLQRRRRRDLFKAHDGEGERDGREFRVFRFFFVQFLEIKLSNR